MQISFFINSFSYFSTPFDLDSADLFNATHYYGRWKKIKKLDGIRNEKFEDVFPELSDIIMLTSPDIIMQNPEEYK